MWQHFKRTRLRDEAIQLNKCKITSGCNRDLVEMKYLGRLGLAHTYHKVNSVSQPSETSSYDLIYKF